MKRADLDYPLPAALIAQHPAEPRESARLLVVQRETGTLTDQTLANLPDWLRTGDLLVVNQSFVLPARFWLRRATGGRIEGLFVQMAPGEPAVWQVMLRGAGQLRVGEQLRFEPPEAGEGVELLAREGRGYFRLRPVSGRSPLDVLGRVGAVPLPEYIHRKAEKQDTRDYQTVFADARQPGSVAAPTAGLHFTPALLEAISRRGVEVAKVTLHVGPGTFQPIKADDLNDHVMHSEHYAVAEQAAARIAACKARGGRVIAVGTTSMRTLEASTGKAGEGWTDIFIRPPYKPQVADALMTNFHLPASTLIALVMSVAGVELTRRAYAHAIAERYRFFSYGDAMLIV